ncbi:right-handed parallel beta-helix repeat-containing protein [Gorillibacterium timonense]|uniref:right-handed parallel beta-helix repeat-containing protein n=1 Tax=Gorillibacterium timonense TaxID=1689269 RepID=UPI00071C3BF1|nr:right-handed parallel beta-helix repeat-containing protein [Gorillibacterium timonense]
MRKRRKGLLTLAVLVIAALLAPSADGRADGNEVTVLGTPLGMPHVEIDLAKFGIYKDGTHPVETTKGINKALKWAQEQGIKSTSLPRGTYLISKDSRIEMVGNMTFTLDANTVIQKETNGKESYQTLFVGYGTDNVTIQGGTYRGDKDKHDYTKKDSLYSSGTHEGGYGIVVEGAKNVTINSVKAINFTGDGLTVGGKGTLAKDFYPAHFTLGAYDDKGKPVASATKIRTVSSLPLTNEIIQKEREFELSNLINLPWTFDLYFYKADNTFLSSLKGQRARTIIALPEGAAYAQAVFEKSSTAGIYMELWNKAVSKDVVVKNSEFAYNRRQGITIGGADRILVENNYIHDMKGTAPQSGIDAEGGFGENGNRNSNLTIKGNEFWNNAAYDLILYDGRDAVVDGNHFASKGAIGLAVSDPFTGVMVKNNHFDGTRINATHDVTFTDNRMNDSFTTFEGPNIVIDRMTFTDSVLSISSKVPFGVTASNIVMYNNKKQQNALALWGKPIKLKDVTIYGETKIGTVVGGIEDGSIFERLRVIGHSGGNLPRGTYIDSVFEAAPGSMKELSTRYSGSTVLDGCTFKSTTMGLYYESADGSLTVRNSTFEVGSNNPAITIQAAKAAVIENNVIRAGKLSSTSMAVIKLNDVSKSKNPFTVAMAQITGNTITTNLAAKGISTLYTGVGAPSYTVTDNVLVKAVLETKADDVVTNNLLR